MTLKDLRSKKVFTDNITLEQTSDISNLVEKRLLLEDLRSYEAKVAERQWKNFKLKKSLNTEYFKIYRFCLDHVSSKISLRCNLDIFPYYKRGTKGFLLDEGCLNLFPENVKNNFIDVLKKGCKMVILEEMVMSIPLEYIKILKGK